jgi:ABC-type antimicrobial peptide transport system permease subunit
VVLGATGTLLGLLLGLQAAHGVNTLTYRIWLFPMKFALPWRFTLGAMALTVGVCLIAGVLPARRAARSNIIDALQTA